MRARLVGWLLAIAVLALGHASLAAASRVAIVRPRAPAAGIGEATTRLSAELRAAGFDVVLIDATPGMDARTQVEATRIEPPPFATIAILGTDRGAVADVWVADHLSAKTLVRRVDVADAAATGAPGALAIRAVELLRASLLEIGTQTPGGSPMPADVAKWMGQIAPPTPPPAVLPPPAPPQSPVIAPKPPAAVAPRRAAKATRDTASAADARPSAEEPHPPEPEVPDARRNRPALFARPAVEGGAGLLVDGFGPAFGPALRISRGGPFGLAGRLSVIGPAFGSSLDRPQGSASLRQELLQIEVLAPLTGGASTFVPVLSLGVGGYHLHVQGRGNLREDRKSSYSGVSEEAWGAVLDGGIGIAARLTDDVALLLDVHGLALAPDPLVRIVGIEAGRAGFPLMFTSLGVVVAF